MYIEVAKGGHAALFGAPNGAVAVVSKTIRGSSLPRNRDELVEQYNTLKRRTGRSPSVASLSYVYEHQFSAQPGFADILALATAEIVQGLKRK